MTNRDSHSRIDLHLHTTCSDGTLTPEETVDEALSRGLKLISITDHDTIRAIAPASKAAAGRDLRLLSGIELNTDYKGQEVHVLGYGFEPESDAMREALGVMLGGRSGRNEAILERLRALGKPVAMERVKELAAGKVVTRPHIAKAMLEAGYVRSIQEAFDKYLKKGAPAFVERRSLTPQEACGAILGGGGVPVLAHPGKTNFDTLFRELLTCGLRGLEVYHPDHTESDSKRFLKYARKHDLLITGGTDSHGPYSGRPVEMGSIHVPWEAGEALMEAVEAHGAHCDR